MDEVLKSMGTRNSEADRIAGQMAKGSLEPNLRGIRRMVFNLGERPDERCANMKTEAEVKVRVAPKGDEHPKAHPQPEAQSFQLLRAGHPDQRFGGQKPIGKDGCGY